MTVSSWLPTSDLPGAVGHIAVPCCCLWVLDQDVPGEAQLPLCSLQAYNSCPAGLLQLLGLHDPPEHHHTHVHVYNVRTPELGRDQRSVPHPLSLAIIWHLSLSHKIRLHKRSSCDPEQVIPMCSLSCKRVRMDGEGVLQTLMLCFEVFSEESQRRDAKTDVVMLETVGRLRMTLMRVVFPTSRVGKRRAQPL